jgi:hypothetical protein
MTVPVRFPGCGWNEGGCHFDRKGEILCGSE